MTRVRKETTADTVYLVMQAEPQEDGWYGDEWVRIAYLNQKSPAHRTAKRLTFLARHFLHPNGMPCYKFWVTQKKIHKEGKS